MATWSSWATAHRSNDGGSSFTEINPTSAFFITPQTPGVDHLGVAISRGNSNFVYIYGEWEVYEGDAADPHWEYFYLVQTWDNGATWNERTVPDATDTDRVAPLRCVPGKNYRVVLHEVQNDDLYRSVNYCNGGWTALDTAMDFDPSDMRMDEESPINVITIGNGAAEAVLVERTYNEGTTWINMTGNLDDDTGDYVTAIVAPRKI
jgi:hypothetical protein